MYSFTETGCKSHGIISVTRLDEWKSTCAKSWFCLDIAIYNAVDTDFYAYDFGEQKSQGVNYNICKLFFQMFPGVSGSILSKCAAGCRFH